MLTADEIQIKTKPFTKVYDTKVNESSLNPKTADGFPLSMFQSA